MAIVGFGVTGYRSFGPDPQILFPLQKVNLIAGRNNTGKSNVLRVVELLQNFLRDPPRFVAPADLDAHIGKRSASFSWTLPFDCSRPAVERLAASLDRELSNSSRWIRLIEAILEEFPERQGDVIWLTHDASSGWRPKTPDPTRILRGIENKNPGFAVRNSWRSLWSSLTDSSGGSFEQHHGPIVLKRLISTLNQTPTPTYAISAHRQIGLPGSTPNGLNGEGLIAKLLELQNPELSKRDSSLSRFQRINEFVAKVLEEPNARLEIPHSAKELNVSMSGKVLPIESLGTGVHEVIIFAAAATAVEDAIVCIEEPEIHLHPRLQRQLLEYLKSQTSNQYFITTHSASLLDSPEVATFHVSLNSQGETEIHALSQPGQRASIAFDLGFRPSDLVQSNCIIWVEGPSDRIYIRAWIEHVAPELIEGLHYSIMFYGGRLLSHLSADDSSVKAFISLQRLNRHVAIVIDSDRRRAKADLSDTKNRVINEVENTGGLAWVTAGREIENYVDPNVMQETLRHVHQKTSFKPPKTQWDCAYEIEKGTRGSVDKIAIALESTKHTTLGVLDLELRINELVQFIRNANH